MVRSGAMVVAMLVLLSGLAAGYLAGTRAVGDADFDRWEAQERAASAFYEALSVPGQSAMQELLEGVLAPEFTDQRLDIQQTLGRTDFMRAATQEARTFPHRQLVPVSMSSDGGWVVVLVKAVDTAPGRFGGISLPASEHARRELLHVQDGRIIGRVVMEESGVMLRSFEPAFLRVADAGTQTLKIERHDFSAYATERPAFPVDTLIVVDVGRFSVLVDGTAQTLEAGESLPIQADREISISNVTGVPGRLFALFATPIEQPAADANANQLRHVAPDVAVSIAGQTGHFVPNGPCLIASAGVAVMAPGQRVPVHRTTGYELILPTAGTIEVRSRYRDILLTDSERQWQEQVPFASIEPGHAVAASPDSEIAATVIGQESASFWVFTVESSTNCSSSSRSGGG